MAWPFQTLIGQLQNDEGRLTIKLDLVVNAASRHLAFGGRHVQNARREDARREAPSRTNADAYRLLVSLLHPTWTARWHLIYAHDLQDDHVPYELNDAKNDFLQIRGSARRPRGIEASVGSLLSQKFPERTVPLPTNPFASKRQARQGH